MILQRKRTSEQKKNKILKIAMRKKVNKIEKTFVKIFRNIEKKKEKLT